ncbi:MAG: hypothetical protein Q7U06_00025 [Pseudomonadota bacterium]|nr:hypothetical protein [Pseudomonadota bacterium]
MKIRLLPILGLALAFSAACGGGTEPVVVTPPPPPVPVAADGSIGVPECDDYIKKMESCIASADPATKAAMESGFKSTRDAWAQAAAIPETKATLASSCSAMLASVATNCGTVAGTAPVPPALNPDGTPVVAPTTTTTTTTTVVTTTDDTTTTAPTKASSTGAKAPARDTRPPADMSRTRDGGTKSGSGTGTSEPKKDGMGRSRPN